MTGIVATINRVLIAVLLLTGAYEGRALDTITFAKRDADHDFYPDDTTSYYEVRGRITADGFSDSVVRIFIQDVNDHAGILVRGNPLVEPDRTRFPVGVDVDVYGQIGQENGLRFIRLEFGGDMQRVSPGQTPDPLPPLARTIGDLLADAEGYEGTFVTITNATITAGNWPGWKSGGAVTISDGTGSLGLYIHANLDLGGQLAPTNRFDVQGIFAQYDTSPVPDAGYQIWPRAYADIAQTAYIGPQPPELFIPGPSTLSTAPGRETVIDVVGRDRNSEDALTLAMTQGPANAVFTDFGNRNGRFAWTPSPADAGTTTSVVFDVSDGDATATGSVEIVVLTLEKANIVCNEIHWNPHNSIEGDASGDGVRDAKTDEFVEILNLNNDAVDLTGWRLVLGDNTIFTFPAFVLPGESAVVVFGGGTPVGTFGGAAIFSATAWGGGLPNSPGDRRLALLDEDDSLVFSHSYRTFGTPGQSITRQPEGTGDFVLHLTADPHRRFSPGTQANGRTFAGSPITNAPPLILPIADQSVGIGSAIDIAITVIDPDGNPVGLGVTGAPPSAVFTDLGSGTGMLVYTGQVEDIGVFTVTITASDGIDSASHAFQLAVLSSAAASLVINEFLADPDATGGIHVDANNDGIEDPFDDEFVEIVNTGIESVDMTGFILHDAVGLRHVFDPVILPPGGHVVVFGGGSLANFAHGPAQTASTGTLSLNNGGDSIILYDDKGNLITRVDYGASFAAASHQRWPELTGEFENHYTVSGFTRRASPGQRVNGSAFLTNQPPTITGVSDRQAQVGVELTFTVSATEPDGNPITLTASNLPPNAVFAPVAGNGIVNGIFSFTPAPDQTGQSFSVTFIASDVDGTDTRTCLIEVTAGGFWDFEDGSQGWTIYSRASNKDWARTSAGGGAEGSAFKMEANGFGGDAPSDDWLISPPLTLDPALEPAISYWTRREFTGPDIAVMVSTNYPGSGDPLAAGIEWTAHAVTPTAGWTQNTNSLMAYAAMSPVHVAFHYTSTGTGSGEAARWGVDQIRLVSGLILDPPAAQPATGIGASQFTANWNAVAGATGYRLDVYQPGQGITETFTDIGGGTVSSYLTREWTGDGGIEWSAYKARIDQEIDPGNAAITLRNQADSYVISGVITGAISQLSFDVMQVFTGSGGQLTVSILHGPGFATETVLGTAPYTAARSVFAAPVEGVSSDYRIRIDNNTAARPVIDNLMFGEAEVFLAGFAQRDVGDVMQMTVTGTAAETTYHYRVQAYNVMSESVWSEIVVVTTASSGELDWGDDDSDGIPNWWEKLHFKSNTGADAWADPDRDGMTNLEEFIANTNPRDATSVLRVQAMNTSADGRVLVAFSSSTNRLYVLEALPQTQLTAPTAQWIRVSSEVAAADGQTTLGDTNMPPVGGFYRIRVRRP